MKQIRSVVQGYIMNRGRELVEGSEKSVTLTIEECLDFANNVISFDTYDSAVATGYVIGEKFEMEVMMAFPSISSTCFAESGTIIQMTQFERSDVYGSLVSIVFQVKEEE